MSATQDVVAPQISQIIAMDDIARAVHADSKITLETMPKGFTRAGNFEVPTTGDKTREITVDGKKFKVPMTIADENKGKFRYAWLNIESKQQNPEFQGFVIVTKESPAARNGEGELIQERYWNGQNYIKRGTQLLHFCLESYGKDLKESGQKLAIEGLSSFKPEEASATVKTDEGVMGGVVTDSIESYSAEEYESLSGKGRGKKG